MKKRNTTLCTLLICTLLSTLPAHAEDLRAYYEQQRAEIAPTFQAPEPGTEFSIALTSGKKIHGTLVKLTHTEVTLMTDTGEVTHPNSALAKSSRAKLFADDYAKAEARKRTMAHKKELEIEALANIHDGRISVSSKTKTDLDSIKKKGGKTTTTTKTKNVVVELTITTRNKTTHPDTYQLEWFVFSRRQDREITTHDHGTEETTVAAGRSLEHLINAKPITTVTTSKSGKNGKKKPKKDSGEKKAGYLVLLKHGDTILDKQASSKTFLTDAWLEKARNPKRASSRKKK